MFMLILPNQNYYTCNYPESPPENLWKTGNFHIRIDPEIQKNADRVLKRLGMSIPEAVTIFLNQVGLEGGIPFMVRLSKPINFEGNKKPEYCYGLEVPDTYYGCKEQFEYLLRRSTPYFKIKLENWRKNAIENTKQKAGADWNEDIFCVRVLLEPEDKEYGASKSYARLFKDEGLHLVDCLPIQNERNETGPGTSSIIGFYLRGIDTKRAERSQKPRIHSILINRLRKIFFDINETELDIFDIYYAEDWELPYNPYDPNFMTADDY